MDVIFEHRIYLPSIGLIIAFVSAVFYLFLRFTPRFPLATCYLLLTAILVVFSVATYQRNIIWQDKVKLWEDVVRKSPGKARGYFHLGLAYLDKNDMALAAKCFEVSKQGFFKIESHISLGNIYARTGQYDRAIYNFTEAINKYDYGFWKDTSNAYLYYNRGEVYYALGEINNAIKDFTIACEKGLVKGCQQTKDIF
ncbi:MAG: tetratricopeptide repeat protein [Nitrospirae bacterium]|nr:tetratricopeptide repeat protein [Nitrospirota bacterium]